AVIEDSPSWRAFTGQTLEELLGAGWLNALHPDDREPTTKVWAHSIETRTMCETEYRVRRHDGEYRLTAVRGVPLLNADGSVREWIGMNVDITEQRQAENAIRLYADFVKSIPMGVLFLRPDDPADDRTLRLIDANPSASALLGFD